MSEIDNFSKNFSVFEILKQFLSYWQCLTMVNVLLKRQSRSLTMVNVLQKRQSRSLTRMNVLQKRQSCSLLGCCSLFFVLCSFVCNFLGPQKRAISSRVIITDEKKYGQITQMISKNTHTLHN